MNCKSGHKTTTTNMPYLGMKVKIRKNVIKTMTRKFPNGIAVIMALLAATSSTIDWAGYCALTPEEQRVREGRDDELNKSMLYLMNSKNKHAKKGLRLTYSQGNLIADPPTVKGMARYL